MKRTMRVDTQQFIRLLKKLNTLDETLEKMTYGYTNPDTGVYEVDRYYIVKNFFCDFMNCCDSPEYNLRELFHDLEFAEFKESVKDEEPSTYYQRMTKAMVSILHLCQVRRARGEDKLGTEYCNGFSESFEEDLYNE